MISYLIRLLNILNVNHLSKFDIYMLSLGVLSGKNLIIVECLVNLQYE